MPVENKIGDKSEIPSRKYAEFKAKRDKEKKARQERIEERLLSIRLKRFAETNVQKENGSKPNLLLPKPSSKLEQKILKPVQNNAPKNQQISSQIALQKASQPIKNSVEFPHDKNILKRRLANDVTSLKKNELKPKLSNVQKFQQERATLDDKVAPRHDVESRKQQLELWRNQKLEKLNNVNRKNKSIVCKESSTLNNAGKIPLVMRKTHDLKANKHCGVVKTHCPKVVETITKQKSPQKRMSLTSKFLAKKNIRPDVMKPLKEIPKVLPAQPRKDVASCMLDLKRKVTTLRVGGLDLSKSHMKDKLNKWLEGKGKSPSACKRHMCCYGLHSSTPIGGRERLEVRTAVKLPKMQEISNEEKAEPFTESKIRVKKMRPDVQDCNVFKSSHVFLKCREFTNQRNILPKDEMSLFETPIIKRMFIVTPVRRSTRKSCVPLSLRDHDVLVETMDELSVEMKHISIFKANKCLNHAGDILIEEPEKKQLRFDD